jgi:hypothetical protein
MAFWGTGMDADLGHKDPKRKFRWKVQIGDLTDDGVVWYAKTVEKPKMEISSDASHKFLGHTFKFPGSVTWTDISVTLVDPAEAGGADAAKKLLELVQGAGYRFPTDSTVLETISKPKSVTSLGTIVITQIDGDNNAVEQWTLHNPFINKVEFDTLDYSSDDLSEITLGIVYDWAELSKDASGNDPELFKAQP